MAVLLVEELEWVVSISGKTVTNEFRVNRPPITPLSSVSTGMILMLIRVEDNILVISKEPVDFSLVLSLSNAKCTLQEIHARNYTDHDIEA